MAAPERHTPKVAGCALCEEYMCCPEHCCDWDECVCTSCAYCGARGLAEGNADPDPLSTSTDSLSRGRDGGLSHFLDVDGDDPPLSPSSPPPKQTAYVINGLETNIAAGAGLRGIRWLQSNDGCT
mmetsp:Transcript_138/g.468  ORF Transcript_138/g.468 Transcript_138/m.468 type:complete len:125 (-) Transcript_138:110-484(-)